MPRHISFDAVRPGTTFADRYFVVRPIKAGGMGAVYEVQHVRTHKPHALKIMHPDVVAKKGAREKFEQEAYVGTRIQSRHVVDVTDAGVDEATGLPYLVMELLVGSELAALVEREGKVSAQRLVPWLAQVARALDKAHARGIIHRDLKPENIFVARDDEGVQSVKVLDFGIAKMIEGATKEGTDETGTPLYMAPEQTARGQEIGPGTDIWALAIVAYECLVGQTYWRAKSVAEFYRELLFDTLPSPTTRAAEDGVSLPPGFDAWFFGCVDREPAKRFKTAGEAIDVLGQVFGVESSALRSGSFSNADVIANAKTERPPESAAEPASAQPAPAPLGDDELPSFGNRKRTLGIAIAVLFLGGITAAVLAARSVATPQPPPVESATASVASVAAPAPTPVPSGPPATIEEAKRLAEPRRNACVAEAQKRTKALRGKLVVEFQLDEGGAATKEKIVESTFGDAELEVCLLGVIRSLKIAPAAPADPKAKKPKQIFTYSVEQT